MPGRSSAPCRWQAGGGALRDAAPQYEHILVIEVRQPVRTDRPPPRPGSATPRPASSLHAAPPPWAPCPRSRSSPSAPSRSTTRSNSPAPSPVPAYPKPVVILPDGTSSTLPVPPGPPLAANGHRPLSRDDDLTARGKRARDGCCRPCPGGVAPTGHRVPSWTTPATAPCPACATASNAVRCGMAARARPCCCSPAPRCCPAGG